MRFIVSDCLQGSHIERSSPDSLCKSRMTNLEPVDDYNTPARDMFVFVGLYQWWSK